MGFDTGVPLQLYLEKLPGGLLVTIEVTIGSLLIGIILGLLLALLRLAPSRAVAALAQWLVVIGRSLPVPPVLLLVYFALLSISPVAPEEAGLLALGLLLAPYAAELFRSGIQTVPAGYVEAAYALGMSAWTVHRRVVLPIALRVMLPALGQLAIANMLTTAFISQIGGRDITGIGRNIINAYFATWMWLLIAVTYFALAWPLSRLFAWYERRNRLLL
jgi:polar amino acid transport system permease protein